MQRRQLLEATVFLSSDLLASTRMQAQDYPKAGSTIRYVEGVTDSIARLLGAQLSTRAFDFLKDVLPVASLAGSPMLVRALFN